jgi:hypothetical protein
VSSSGALKPSKCSFAQQQINYLGHTISAAGVSTDSSKVQDVKDWPTPANIKELRGFLVLSGYYRKFVRNYGLLSKPLSNMLRKGVPFCWAPEAESAFQSLKEALITAPVLALPDFSRQFIVETDASDLGVGAVLIQGDHPLAFVSKPLGPKTRGLSTYEKEYMAILLAVEKWRSYLQHAEFLIRTDHSSLSCISDQRLHTPWQQKVFSKLIGLQFKIVYRKGVENKVADALSRRPHQELSVLAMSSSQPLWMEEIQAAYENDAQARKLLEQLVLAPDGDTHFTLRDGIIRFDNRIWIPDVPELQKKILQALHSSSVGGHSGIPVTLRRLRQLFHWKGMKTMVRTFVQECQICQQAKPTVPSTRDCFSPCLYQTWPGK